MARRRTTTEETPATTTGKCSWCYREDVTVVKRMSVLMCPDQDECGAARLRALIVNGLRPRSWYEKLAAGRYENRRDARKVGITNEHIKELVESMGLTYSMKETKDSEQRAADDDADA